MTRRLPKPSHHDVKDKRAEAAPWLAAVSWRRDQRRAWQHWWELCSTQGLEKPNSLLWLPAFSCWRQGLEAGQTWRPALQLRARPVIQRLREKVSWSWWPRGHLMGPQGTHTGGSCDWVNDPCGEAVSPTRCFHHYESYQEPGVYSESLKLSQMLLILGRKQ